MSSAIHWIEQVWSQIQFILRISTVYYFNGQNLILRRY